MTHNREGLRNPTIRTAGWGRPLAVAGTLTAWALLGFLPLRPPAVVEADAPASALSAARALEDLRILAQSPHPVGTPEHDAVRDFLVDRLRSLGLEVEIQSAIALRQPVEGHLRGARVQNVMARLRGTGSGDAVALIAHYDSAPTSFGASDDGAAVAALVEAMRALTAEAAPVNDLIFLLTDGEELGLMGAKAFLEQHPWAEQVRLVVNFEARGTHGPSIMFETGPNTGPLMGRFAAAVPRPLAASYSYDVYRYLPNDTDFTLFKQAGIRGFNFAFIDGLPNYHTQRDDLEHLDPRSLQHHGANALALARHFGAADLEALPEGDPAIYFNLPALGLVVYPARWTLPLAVLLAVLTGITLWQGFRVHRLTLRQLFLGLLTVPLIPLLAAVVITGLHRLAVGVFGLSSPMLGEGRLYLLGWILVSAAIVVGLLAALRRKPGLDSLGAAAAVWWLALVILTAIALPSSSYLLVWPLLFGLIGLMLRFRAPGGEAPSTAREGVLLLLAAPALLLWAPAIALIATAFGPGAGTLMAILTALVGVLLVPQIALALGSTRPWLVPGTVLGIGLVLALSAAATASYDTSHPRPSSVFYAHDSESGQAWWASFEDPPDPWTQQFLGDGAGRADLSTFFDFGDRASDLLAAQAPVVPMESAQVTLEEERSASGGRRLRLRVRPVDGASAVMLKVRSRSALRFLSIAGRPVAAAEKPASDAPPPNERTLLLSGTTEEFEIELDLEGSDPLEVGAVARSYGLPTLPGFDPSPRPPDSIPRRFVTTDMSLVRAAYRF